MESFLLHIATQNKTKDLIVVSKTETLTQRATIPVKFSSTSYGRFNSVLAENTDIDGTTKQIEFHIFVWFVRCILNLGFSNMTIDVVLASARPIMLRVWLRRTTLATKNCTCCTASE